MNNKLVKIENDLIELKNDQKILKLNFLSVINETRQIRLDRLEKTVEIIQATQKNLAERGITVTLYGEDIKVMLT